MSILTKIFEQQKFTDVTFILDDGIIQAHKCVLAASDIEFFDKIFNGDNKWQESGQNTITIKDCPKDRFTLLLKAAYGYLLYSDRKKFGEDHNKFDPQLLADLVMIGDRFQSPKCIKYAFSMVNNQESRNAGNWLPYVLKIFHKFSPVYNEALKQNLHYTNKVLSFSIRDDSTKLTLDKHVYKIINRLKVKYVLYLANLDKQHDIAVPIVRRLLGQYDKNNINMELHGCIDEIIKNINPALLKCPIIIQKLAEFNFKFAYDKIQYIPNE